MGELVQLGNLPAWIADFIAGAAAWKQIRGHKQDQATDFINLVLSLGEIESSELEAALASSPRISEIFERLWTTAADSAAASKRKALARLAVRTLAALVSGHRTSRLMVIEVRD